MVSPDADESGYRPDFKRYQFSLLWLMLVITLFAITFPLKLSGNDKWILPVVIAVGLVVRLIVVWTKK